MQVHWQPSSALARGVLHAPAAPNAGLWLWVWGTRVGQPSRALTRSVLHAPAAIIGVGLGVWGVKQQGHPQTCTCCSLYHHILRDSPARQTLVGSTEALVNRHNHMGGPQMGSTDEKQEDSLSSAAHGPARIQTSACLSRARLSVSELGNMQVLGAQPSKETRALS